MFGENLVELRKYHNMSQEELTDFKKKEGFGLGVPSKGKHGSGMVKVGDKGRGLALVKEKGLLDLIHEARKMGGSFG